MKQWRWEKHQFRVENIPQWQVINVAFRGFRCGAVSWKRMEDGGARREKRVKIFGGEDMELCTHTDFV